MFRSLISVFYLLNLVYSRFLLRKQSFSRNVVVPNRLMIIKKTFYSYVVKATGCLHSYTITT